MNCEKCNKIYSNTAKYCSEDGTKLVPSNGATTDVPKKDTIVSGGESKLETIGEFIKRLSDHMYFIMLKYDIECKHTRIYYFNKELKKNNIELPEHLRSYSPIIVRHDLVNNNVIMTHYSEYFGDYVDYINKDKYIESFELCNYDNWLYYSGILEYDNNEYTSNSLRRLIKNIDILKQKFNGNDELVKKNIIEYNLKQKLAFKLIK